MSLLARYHCQKLNARTIVELFTPFRESLDQVPILEALNSRSLEQMVQVYENLQKQATVKIPIAKKFSDLGDLIAVDGSLIDATLSMHWADYRKEVNNAKVHLGFDIGRGIPQKMVLTNGKGDERSAADRLVAPGQTGVYD